MKKEYQRPEIEFVSLITEEAIASTEGLEGEMGTESNNLFQ